MPLIEWDDTLSVHNDVADQHHKRLVQLLNRTYDDFTQGAPPRALGCVIEELLDYATYHFSTEERLMSESGYPDLEEHREEHSRFVLKIAWIRKNVQEGEKHLSFETISFLKNWIAHHIRECDSRYGEFLAKKKAGALPQE